MKAIRRYPSLTREHVQPQTGIGGRVSYHPESLIKLKSLELRAKVVVEGFMSGLHRSPYHGFSVEFTDYRPYSAGDDLRYLDWRLLARSDRHYIKRFEDETNLRCYLVVDLSRSMGYGSLTYTKADYAKTLAATLIYFLSLQRDAVGLLTFADQLGQFVPPRYRPGHMRRLMLALESSLTGTATDIARPLEQIAKTFRKRGMVVIVSDFLAPTDHLLRNLAYLRSLRHEVILIRVLDPTELTFDFANPTMFVDAESQRDLYIDPAAARAGYLRRFAAHRELLEQGCRQIGAEWIQVTSDQPLDRALFDFVSARQQKHVASLGPRTQAAPQTTSAPSRRPGRQELPR